VLRLGVACVVFDRDRVLLTLRTDVPVWILPGGGVEAGESVEQAAVRETREETGLLVQVVRLVGVYNRPHWRHEDRQVVVEGRVVGGAIATSDESSEVAFFPLDRLPRDVVPWNVLYIGDAMACRAGHRGPFLRTLDMRWPFGDQETPRQVVQRLVRGGMSQAEAQRAFIRQIAANVGELPSSIVN
jgi:ADP-ribose pyrophosphatase YjhB (NUDIX family)